MKARPMNFERILVAVLMGLLTANVAHAGDPLARQFATPLAASRPWVYAFIVDGNLSKEGITADLEAMKRAGIGGLLVFDGTQQGPPGPARFMSPLWSDLFKHLIAEAKRLGLEVSINNDAGWAGSGGPWNTQENNCQRVVSTAMQVTGPKQLDAPVQRPFMKLDYYRDIALLAFPTPKCDKLSKTAIDAHFAGFLQKLIDDRSAAAIRLARPGAINDN